MCSPKRSVFTEDVQWPRENAANERWCFQEHPSGNFNIISESSGLALDVENESRLTGTPIVQWGLGNGQNQQFALVDAAGQIDIGTPPFDPAACVAVETVGSFNIVASHSGKGLAVEDASTTEGAKIVQKPLGGGGTDLEWTFLPSSGVGTTTSGWYHILNLNSNLAMNVEGAETDDGAWIIQWPFDLFASNDNFCFQDAGDGTFYIVAEHSGDAFDVSDQSTDTGAAVVQWPLNGGANQKFRLITAGSQTCANPFNDTTTTTFEIRARHSSMNLAVSNDNTDEGARLIQTASGSSTTWTLSDSGDGSYSILNVNSGRAVNVAGDSRDLDASIVQWTVDPNAENDNWCFMRIDGEGDYYSIVSASSGLAIDVEGAETTDGAMIVQWTLTGDNNQQWQLIPVATAEAGSTETQFRSSGKAFDVTMNLLTPDVLDGYETTEEVDTDLEQAARFYVNSIIEAEGRYDYTRFPIALAVEDNVQFSTTTTAQSSPSAEGATDFETNNQEEGVDEADFVKSDGEHVFAVYGDMVVVWEALTGEFVVNYTLPALASSNTNCWWCRPSIRGMSLESNRLVLYATGYGTEVRNGIRETAVFNNAYDTRIIVFDTSTLPASLDLVTQEDVHGTYRDARAIGSNIHVVTTCNINYNALASPLYRWNKEYNELNRTEYIAMARNISEPLIKTWAAQLKLDIQQYGLPTIPKISLWQTDLGNSSNIVEQIYSSGAIQAFTNVLSFNVAGLSGDLAISTAGAFTPSSWGYTYAVDGYLVFAAQGWNWMSRFGGSGQTTYLLGFELNGATARPLFLGSCPGNIINQYSVSMWEGHLRVATTVQQWWPVWIWDDVTDDEEPPIVAWPQPQFTTENQVYILRVPTANEKVMRETGRIEGLGKVGERFTAVRFFGLICYVVTFRRTDPFYVLDLTPNTPSVLGELEISGFSSYIHSINNDDTLLVAVGQEADENGVVLGLQVTLFDASNASNPVLLHRETVEQERDVWSSSNVQWDFKAFRYLPLVKTVGAEAGVVILPLRVYSWSQDNLDGNYDGFIVYDVSRTGISQRLNVSHVESRDFYGCYYRAQLPQRSLVFNGNVTTLKGHSVISTDLDSFEEGWRLEMPKPVRQEACGYWI